MNKSITTEVSEYLARIEDETIKKIMAISGKSDRYSFENAGYDITKQQLKGGIDGIMSWRITLTRYGEEIIHRDITVKMTTVME